jgi:hypothetical protein
VTTRNSVGRYRHLEWTHRLLLEGTKLHGVTSLKTAIRISYLDLTEVKSSKHIYKCLLFCSWSIAFCSSYNPFCLWLQPEADTQSHTFRCKVFKRPRPCNLCHQPIHHQGSCCRGELGTGRYWNASVKPMAVLDVTGMLA